MKKQAALILLALPFVLVFLIAGIGELFRASMRVPVQELYFLDQEGAPIDLIDFTYELFTGESYSIKYRVLPQSAKDRNVEFSCDDKITFHDEGFMPEDKTTGIVHITAGLKTGYSTLIVQTKDRTKMNSVRIHITEPQYVAGIALKEKSISMKALTIFNLQESDNPFVATIPQSLPAAKRILSFSSTNTGVASIRSIANQNRIYTLAPGSTTIVVSHILESGETISETILVTVSENLLSWSLSPEPASLAKGIASAGIEMKLKFDGQPIAQNAVTELTFYDETNKTTPASGVAYIENELIMLKSNAGAIITITAVCKIGGIEYCIQSTCIIIN